MKNYIGSHHFVLWYLGCKSVIQWKIILVVIILYFGTFCILYFGTSFCHWYLNGNWHYEHTQTWATGSRGRNKEPSMEPCIKYSDSLWELQGNNSCLALRIVNEKLTIPRHFKWDRKAVKSLIPYEEVKQRPEWVDLLNYKATSIFGKVG